ncbi:MAG: hypothetical protein ACYC8T_37590, partial [Myxococcaceae bacterium]
MELGLHAFPVARTVDNRRLLPLVRWVSFKSLSKNLADQRELLIRGRVCGEERSSIDLLHELAEHEGREQDVSAVTEHLRGRASREHLSTAIPAGYRRASFGRRPRNPAVRC